MCQRIEALQMQAAEAEAAAAEAAAAKEPSSAVDAIKEALAEEEDEQAAPAERGASPAEAAEHERQDDARTCEIEVMCESDETCAAAVRTQRVLQAPASAEAESMRHVAFTALQVRANTGPIFPQLHPRCTVHRGYQSPRHPSHE